jgi:hypothetical protein
MPAESGHHIQPRIQERVGWVAQPRLQLGDVRGDPSRADHRLPGGLEQEARVETSAAR